MLLIDKPPGISSFDVIRHLRRLSSIRKLQKEEGGQLKIGHAGTLDPLASGLLLVALGDETKDIGQYVGLDKSYEVQVVLGERRSTGDREGEIVEEADVPDLLPGNVQKVLDGMCRTLMLPVPEYSAVKQGGVPLYKKVRRGERVVVPVRAMQVHRAHLSGLECRDGRCYLDIEMLVASGVYVRSVVEELGRRLTPTPFAAKASRKDAAQSASPQKVWGRAPLIPDEQSVAKAPRKDAAQSASPQKVWGQGYPATVGALRRTRVGSYEVGDALQLTDTDGLNAVIEEYAQESQKRIF